MEFGEDIKMESVDAINHLNYVDDFDDLFSNDFNVDVNAITTAGNVTSITTQEEFETPVEPVMIAVHMEVREPIYALRLIVQQKINEDLSNYPVLLQYSQVLPLHTNLVEQCIKSEGIVQINVEVNFVDKNINIIDVLRPTEEAIAELELMQQSNTNTAVNEECVNVEQSPAINELETTVESCNNEEGINSETLSTSEEAANNDEITISISEESISNEGITSSDDVIEDDSDIIEVSSPRMMEPIIETFQNEIGEQIPFVTDTRYERDQERLKIPRNPAIWTIAQVKHWLQYAVRQFNMTQIKLSDWNITGKELCDLTLEEFQTKVPHDPDQIFWFHFQLLRNSHRVTCISKNFDNYSCDGAVPDGPLRLPSPKIIRSKITTRKPPHDGSPEFHQGNRSGNNGQIQLWQFLLELLTDVQHTSIIKWSGNEGEFELINPEAVAALWGTRKNKRNMNYEKLSRALRYYYDGDLLAKVSGEKFNYQFVYDLKELVGFSGRELRELMKDAKQRVSGKETE